MKKQGDKFGVGDRAIIPGLGWGKVTSDDGSDHRPLEWKSDSGYSFWAEADGASQGIQIMYHANQGVIEIDTDEPVRAEDLALDQPLLVINHGGAPLNRHFASFENGTVYCWSNGQTSHTANEDEISRWDNWRLPKSTPCP